MNKTNSPNNLERVAIVAAVPETMLAFMSGYLQSLSNEYKTYAVCSDTSNIPLDRLIPGVKYIDILINRKISPFQDLISLFKLIYLFKSCKITLVQSITPKAGLLSMLAAWICRVPIRVHFFTGQIWVTKRGFSRWCLKNFDRLIVFLATALLADSNSQKQFLASEGVAKVKDIEVLGDGSICGVDSSRFKPNHDAKKIVRSQLGIPEEATVALFMGRLKKDKGVLDLARAYSMIQSELTNLYLIFAGPDEENLASEILQLTYPKCNQIRFVGPVSKPEDFFAAANFLCLPSHREGFGLVTIEAAAAGIPTLASRIYGITDAVIDGVTGILHKPGDLADIVKGMQEMMQVTTCQKMGVAAKNRALEMFSTSRLVKAQLDYYQTLIENHRNHA